MFALKDVKMEIGYDEMMRRTGGSPFDGIAKLLEARSIARNEIFKEIENSYDDMSKACNTMSKHCDSAINTLNSIQKK